MKKINPILDAVLSGKPVSNRMDAIKSKAKHIQEMEERLERYKTQLTKAKTEENKRYWQYRVEQLELRIKKY
ncbi:MAG: hypothetical protein GOV15_01765 [Candidatus Diapherotrites archaeon]|nr:hypothetical protein [Candidatus Diapherotrites archaeon]